MLAYVPVVFDVYRPLKPRLRWAMQCLVSFADHAGRCFPSIRTFALHAGISKSAASRDLSELVETGFVTRKRRPGGVYIYRIDRRFLPRGLVSQLRNRKNGAASWYRPERPVAGVPACGTKENPQKNIQGSARFAEIGTVDDSDRWRARVRSWRKSRFWLPTWGPQPNEPGCFMPTVLLSSMLAE